MSTEQEAMETARTFIAEEESQRWSASYEGGMAMTFARALLASEARAAWTHPTHPGSPYRDCGKCQYLGGCSICDHPEWREIVYARAASAHRAGMEEAARVAEGYAMNAGLHRDLRPETIAFAIRDAIRAALAAHRSGT